MQPAFDASTGPIVHSDSERRDTLTGTEGEDIFQLSNDGKTDIILSMEDGIDLIDLTALDATYDQLQIRQISLTEYVVDYQGEDRIRITFEEPRPRDIPESGILLDESDFLFREGLPDATPQVILHQVFDGPETLYGTTSPDIFVLSDDQEKDVIRKFEPGKDVIDLASYGVTFSDLRIIEKREGRIVINVPGVSGRDKIVLIDVSKQLTEADITEDFFIL